MATNNVPIFSRSKDRIDLFKKPESFRIPPKIPEQIKSFYKVMGLPSSCYLNKSDVGSRSQNYKPVKKIQNRDCKVTDKKRNFISVLVRIKDCREEGNRDKIKDASVALTHWDNRREPVIKFKDQGSLIVYKYFRRLIPPQTSQHISFQTIVPPQMIQNFFHGFHTNILLYGGIHTGKSFTCFGPPGCMKKAEQLCKQH